MKITTIEGKPVISIRISIFNGKEVKCGVTYDRGSTWTCVMDKAIEVEYTPELREKTFEAIAGAYTGSTLKEKLIEFDLLKLK